MLFKILKWLGLFVLVIVLGLSSFVGFHGIRYGQSMAKTYDLPIPKVTLPTDAAALARGKHLAFSLGGCATADCHGSNLSGGKEVGFGPLGVMRSSNITRGGLGGQYSDGELFRLLRHGITRTGKSVLFMPVQDFNWLPEKDLLAIIAWVRSVPPSSKSPAPMQVTWIGRIFDRLDWLVFDVGRRIDHKNIPQAPPPAPTAHYGSFIARGCQGCHGDHLSGGPIPGAPPNIPPPTNLTPHETGLKTWTMQDFRKAIATARRPNGTTIHSFMPLEILKNMNEIELQALWNHLRSLPPRPLGQR